MRKKLKKLFQIKTALYLIGFLILSSCAHQPIDTKFDGHWTFIRTNPGGILKACLDENEVSKLREVLIRCEMSAK